jgi:hypothetical protein
MGFQLKECPVDTFNLDFVSNYMLEHNKATIVDTFTVTEQTSVIKDFLYLNGFRDAEIALTNAFVYFKGAYYSYLAQFVDGCSTLHIQMDPDAAFKFLNLFGVPV